MSSLPSLNSLIPTIGKTMKCVDMVIRSELQEAGLDLTKNQFILLRLLQDGPAPQSSLALVTERNKGSLARLIHSMENKELVRRVVSESDRRVNLVEITENGMESFKQARPLVQTVIDKLQNGLTENERNSAKHVLEKVMANAIAELETYCPSV